MSDKLANTSAETIDVRELEDGTGNIYLSVNIISKRANQLSTKLKEEIKNRLEPYESDGDSLEEIHEMDEYNMLSQDLDDEGSIFDDKLEIYRNEI